MPHSSQTIGIFSDDDLLFFRRLDFLATSVTVAFSLVDFATSEFEYAFERATCSLNS